MADTTYTYTPTDNLDLRSGRTNATIWRNELGDMMLELCPDSDADAGVQLKLDWRSARVLSEALSKAITSYCCSDLLDGTTTEWMRLIDNLTQLGFIEDEGWDGDFYQCYLDGERMLEVSRRDDGAFELLDVYIGKDSGREDDYTIIIRTTSADELLAHTQRVIDLANTERALATYVQIDKALGEV